MISLEWATLGNKRFQFYPEPSAHPAIEEEVESRVEDEEDVIEMRHADEVGRDAVATMSENMSINDEATKRQHTYGRSRKPPKTHGPQSN
jgi:hypothetical protein